MKSILQQQRMSAPLSLSPKESGTLKLVEKDSRSRKNSKDHTNSSDGTKSTQTHARHQEETMKAKKADKVEKVEKVKKAVKEDWTRKLLENQPTLDLLLMPIPLATSKDNPWKNKFSSSELSVVSQPQLQQFCLLCFSDDRLKIPKCVQKNQKYYLWGFGVLGFWGFGV